jgi:2-polyprenyl-6-methoxyphenol hydroxylase-like FAD-dependent oxidoreductase
MQQKPIVIIGCGFAGAALALFLKRAGIKTEIYEARSAKEVDTGAFLYIAPNGMKVLTTLGLDRTFEQGQDGFPTTGIVFQNSRGRRVGEIDNRQDFERHGARGHVLKREQIYRVLRDELLHQGIKIHYGKQLQSIKLENPEQITAFFEDGTSTQGCGLIGADGINSRTRNILIPNAPKPRYTGLVDTGGFAQLPDRKDFNPAQHMIFGRNAFFGYTFKPTGEVYWFSNVPWQNEPSRTELSAISANAWKQRLLTLHAHDPEPVLEIIKATPEAEIGKWASRDLPALTHWHQGAICLMGDAAHATSPSAGQGASMALEDAIVLAKCLRDIPKLETAFGAFQAQRKTRVEAIVQAARRNGENKIPHPIMGLFRDLLLPVFLKAGSKAAHQIYDYQVNWDSKTNLDLAKP